MVPPSINNLRRLIKNREYNANYYFLYEGQNTEPLFIDYLFNFVETINFSIKINFHTIGKVGNEIGITQPTQLIKYAAKVVNTIPNFDKSIDKIVMVFDLDVFNNQQNLINDFFEKINDDYTYIIPIYTNPAFELILLMAFDQNFIVNLTKNEKDKILLNHWVDNNSKTVTKSKNAKRYVSHLFQKITQLNSKKQNPHVSELASNISFVIQQEKSYLNTDFKNAANSLTSNFGTVMIDLMEDDVSIKK